MTIYEGASQPTATVTVTGAPDPLQVIGGTITLDKGYSPYVQASVTVALSTGLGELLDPRTTQRVTITIQDAAFDLEEPRVFDLMLRGRTVDHSEQTITIEAASDEAMLHDTKRLAGTVDRTARQYEASLRGVVNWALGKIGAALDETHDDPDRAVPASWDQTNLIHNPRGTTGWQFPASGATVTSQIGATAVEMEGQTPGTTIRTNVTAGGTGWTAHLYGRTANYQMPATEGRLYTASCFVTQDTGTTKTVRLELRFINAAGATVRTNRTDIDRAHGGYEKITATGAAPANTERIELVLFLYDPTTGSHFQSTAWVLAEGVENDRWFDGDRPDEDDSETFGYVYDWTPDAQATPSTRTALYPRDPEVFGWEPGQSLFDFLRPFLESSGMQLYCNEQRVWRLVPSYLFNSPGGQFNATATGEGGLAGTGNTIRGRDEISRESDDWASGVVVAYTWRTANGDRKTKYDVAGTGEKVLRIDRDTAWPGTGAAAAILEAMTGRGRTQTVTIARGFYATPGDSSIVRLPGTAEQTGLVKRVTLDLANGNAEATTTTGTEILP